MAQIIGQINLKNYCRRVQMDRQDLKEYKYTEKWIKGRINYLREYRATIDDISSILSDMPKRK